MLQRIVITVLVACTLQACSDSESPGALRAQAYNVTVTRTALGIPHINAGDFGSLGYGYGYAHAEDNLCVLQDHFLTNRGERARYLGRDGTYTIIANGAVAGNVDSDFFWKLLATDAAWQRLKRSATPELQAASTGFRDGWNRYVREIKAGVHPGRHASCRNEPWVFEITEADVYRRYFHLALFASSSVFVSGIATAQPPPTEALPGAPLPGAALSSDEVVGLLQANPGPLRALMPEGRDAFGSNMYALSKDAVASGAQSMVFGNPHFPWSGTERLYIHHLTVPGRLDIMGSSLYGVPAINIGFNDHFAWSHTVSTAYRFTIYQLTLNPASPTQYVYDGGLRDMEAVPLTVDVKETDGTVTQESRTLYRTHYGPILGLNVSGQNVLPWTPTTAFTLRDANAENDRLLNQFAHWNQAKSLDEFIALHKSILGIPWVNTIASGPNGKAYYGDVSVVPHVTDGQVQLCAARPLHDAFQQLVPGLPVLDGSRADCEWGTDEDAPAPGIFGPGNLPTLQRDDWVHNCNDSYWLTNPEEPITGYDRIIGAENSARSLRTRLCIQHVARHLGKHYADGLGATFDDGDRRFTLDELQDTVLSSQIYSAQRERDAVVADICPQGMVPTRDGPVDVSGACTVLQAWDLTDNLTSVGGHIWREFFRLAQPNPAGVGPNPLLWTTSFSATDPVNTPRGINTASPGVQEALGRAVTQIEGAGIALDAPIGSLQRSGVIGETVIPIFGGTGTEGAFTIVSVNALDEDGYRVTYGNSYIQTVTWEPDGAGFKPRAEGFVTYSQSTDPASPHFADFTREYSAKRWHRFPFRPAEIEAAKISSIRLTQ